MPDLAYMTWSAIALSDHRLEQAIRTTTSIPGRLTTNFLIYDHKDLPATRMA